jgi:hypothetical protein
MVLGGSMSEEWGELSPERIGRATASRISDVIATIKSGGYGASRERYRTQLVLERLTGVMATGYENAAIRWGKDNEPLARIAYELHADLTVEKAGFIVHPTIAMSGASPDGLINNDGLIEIKCPESHTHLATLSGQPIDARYIAQIQWQLACSRRLWTDFVSFDSRFPEEMRLFVRRINRDNAMIAKLEEEVVLFLHEVDAAVGILKAKYGKVAAA